MSETANLGLPYWAENQAQPHVTHNEALDLIDAAVAAGGGSGGGVAEVTGPLGSFLRIAVFEADLSGLSGGSATAAGLIPARAIVLSVTSWTIEAVTGATSYAVGQGEGQSQFGSSLSVSQGAQNIGVVGPFATYSPTDIVVTAEGGNFTGGRVGLSAAVLLPGRG